jgi:hypothetical protein
MFIVKQYSVWVKRFKQIINHNLVKNTKEGRTADKVYLGETNVGDAYLVSFVVFFATRELALDL